MLAFSLLQEDDYLPGTPGLLTPSGATTAETAALLHPLAFQATRLESTLQPPCFLRGETPLCYIAAVGRRMKGEERRCRSSIELEDKRGGKQVTRWDYRPLQTGRI